MEQQQWAALVIQKAYRGYTSRKDYKRTLRALVWIQARIKGWLQKRDFQWMLEFFEENEEAIIIIQSGWRGYQARKLAAELRRQANNNARLQHKNTSKKPQLAKILQAVVRGHISRQQYGRLCSEAEARRAAAEEEK
eukprot:gene6850-9517_t